MLFIKNTMKKNKDLINKLQNQLSESDSRGEELKRTMQATIDALVSQMEAKDLQLNELRGVISEKEVKITQMDEAITTLNNDVADLKNEATQKKQPSRRPSTTRTSSCTWPTMSMEPRAS